MNSGEFHPEGWRGCRFLRLTLTEKSHRMSDGVYICKLYYVLFCTGCLEKERGQCRKQEKNG